MIKNNKGFTAIEMMVGIGLVAILTTIIVSTQLMVTNDQMKLQKQLEQSIDTNLAERIIFTDLANIDPSYNNLTVKDDAGLQFFDYYPDVPASMLSNVKREVALRLDSKTREFHILAQDTTAGPLMTYDPTAAYKVGTSDSFDKSADLTFVGLNYQDWIKKNRKYFWLDGKALMLDTPARLRPVDANGNVIMTVAPRSPIFVGKVARGALENDSVIRSLVNTTNPETGQNIDNADTFLRRLPSMGGGLPVVRLRAVRIVKYYLQPYTDNRLEGTPANLYKAVYENGKWSDPFLLADRVEELNLRRDSVTKRMIYFKVKKLKEKEQRQAGS